MRRFDNVIPEANKIGVPLRHLVVAMTAMMVLPVAQADVIGKGIGDLEIYKAAEGGKTTITMMLDTSGSMSSAVVGASACDLPSGVSANRINSETSTTTPTYTRTYCATAGDKRYFYRRTSGFFSSTRWYRCGGNDGLGTSNINACNTEINAPSTNGYDEESTGNFFNTTTYYFKTIEGDKYYDRLTRLKDALFTLMDNTQIDPKKVAIGIGQFSTQSNSSNQFTGADGRSGKILVPAALLTDAQRRLIKTEIAGLIGSNGTPTANAYAEAGAYMLGTNTVYTSGGFTVALMILLILLKVMATILVHYHRPPLVMDEEYIF